MQAADTAASTGFIPQQAPQRSRILSIKSSAKGRQAAPSQSVWNRIEAVAASRPVPSTSSVTQRLGAMNLSSATRPGVPWTGTSTASTTPRPPVRTKPAPIGNTMDDFPSLPTKPKQKIVLNAAAGPARQVAAWSDTSTSAPSQNGSETTESENKSKGKKKGKTVLFHVG